MNPAYQQDVNISDDGKISIGPKRPIPRTALQIDAPTNERPNNDINIILQARREHGGVKPMKK